MQGEGSAVASGASLDTVVNYAGAIVGPARFDVVDMSRTNLALEPRTVTLHNARTLAVPPTLEREGLTLVRHKSAVCHSQDHQEIDKVYHEELCRLIADQIGADLVAPQRTGLLIRRGERSTVYALARPARFAHLDYSPKSVGDFTRWMQDWESFDATRFSRMVIVQTWRALSPPPQDNTLALCDARSLAADDTLPFESVLDYSGAPGSRFQSRLAKPNPAHRWLFWPDLQDDELLMFKSYDSDATKPFDVAHTAVDNPLAGPDAAPRESLEARFFAFFR